MLPQTLLTKSLHCEVEISVGLPVEPDYRYILKKKTNEQRVKGTH